MSGFSKIIPVGNAGQLSITEAGGVATLAFSIAEVVGGGSTAGVVKAKVNAEVDISAIQLIDAGLALLEAKYPSVAPVIATVKGIIDAEAVSL